MNLEFIPYYIYLVISLILVNITGKLGMLFINIKPQKTFFRVFLELFLGIVTVVFLYSVIKTRFLTVNILFLVIFCFYFFLIDRKRLRLPEKKNLISAFSSTHKDIFILALACLPFFLYELFFLYRPTGFKMPWQDFFYYSGISDSFIFFGRENSFFSLNAIYPSQYKVITPYHYFEIWFNAFHTWLYHCPSVLSLMFITYPLLNCAVFIGMAALWEMNSKVTLISILFIILLFFTDGLYISIYDNIPFICEHKYPLQSSLMTIWGKKYPAVYLFIVLFLLLSFKGKKKESFFTLSSLLIISVGMFAGVLAGVFLYLFLNKFHKTFTKKDNVLIILFYIILSVCFSLFFFVFRTSDSTNDYMIKSNFLSVLLSDIKNISHYKYLAGMMLNSFLTTLFLYFPFVAIAIITYKKLIKKNPEFNKIIILVLFINFAGLIAYGFAIGLSNSFQLFSNTFTLTTILLNLIFLYGLINIIKCENLNKKRLFLFIYVFLISLICVNIFSNIKINSGFYLSGFSDKYKNKVLAETKSSDFIIAGCLNSREDYKGYNLEYINFNKPGHLINFSYGYKDLVNLNSFIIYDKIDIMSSTSRYLLENSELYIFIENQKKTGQFKSYQQSQLDFIDKYKIKYLFANKGAEAGDSLRSRIKQQFVDSISGEQFYILNNE